MSKLGNASRTAPGTARSVATSLRISPIKLNLVAGLIRGKPCDQALNELQFSRKRIAQDVTTTLLSAIANAENNYGLDVDRLYVAQAYVGKAMRMRRFRPRAKGRGVRIIKPFSRLTIVVEERAEEIA